MDFVELDVERDAGALERVPKITGRDRPVPVLIKQVRPPRIGWMDRGCVV